MNTMSMPPRAEGVRGVGGKGQCATETDNKRFSWFLTSPYTHDGGLYMYLYQLLSTRQPLLPRGGFGRREHELCTRLHVVDDEVPLLRVHVERHGDIPQLRTEGGRG